MRATTRRWTRRFAFPLLAIGAWAIAAARLDAASGPEAGTAVPALSAERLGTAGDYETFDAAAAAKDKPIVCVFIQANRFDRPIGRFLRALDERLRDFSAQAEIVAIWLPSDATATRDYLPRVAQSLALQHTSLGLHTGADSKPEGWNLSDDAHVTVVVLANGKVASSIGLTSTNENNVPHVGEAIQAAVTEK